MCIHAEFNEKELRWIPTINSDAFNTRYELICRTCGRKFTYTEYIKLIKIIDPNYDTSFTHCFGRMIAPSRSTIETNLKSSSLD